MAIRVTSRDTLNYAEELLLDGLEAKQVALKLLVRWPLLSGVEVQHYLVLAETHLMENKYGHNTKLTKKASRQFVAFMRDVIQTVRR